MRHFCVEDHCLHLHPFQLIFCKTCNFTLLSLRVLEEQDADKEVQEEETAYKDEDYKEDGLLDVSLVLGSAIHFCNVHSLVHDGGPAFERRDHKESHHCLAHVIEIGIVSEPLASL